MELNYNYEQIYDIAKEVKKKHTISQIVEIANLAVLDEDVLNIFVRVGAGANLKDNRSALKYISDNMENGEDIYDIQLDVIRALIRANFYAKELQKILDAAEAAAAQDAPTVQAQ